MKEQGTVAASAHHIDRVKPATVLVTVKAIQNTLRCIGRF